VDEAGQLASCAVQARGKQYQARGTKAGALAPWIVLIEAALTAADLTVESASVERLLTVFAKHHPSAMYSRDRYVLQVVMPGSSPDEALRKVLTSWRRSVLAAGLAGFKLVRAEVMTPDELEAEAASRSDLHWERSYAAAGRPRGVEAPPA
jgi:hypothetical protein